MNQQIKMSEQDQVVEATNSNEELELELETEGIEETETLEQQLERERIARQQLTARAKKAEAELKALKEKPATATQNITSNGLSAEDVEIRILKAAGRTEDEINYLKKLAAVNGGSIIEAQSDELFTNYKSKKEADAKAQKAKLGASRGSSTVKAEKSFTSTGLTDAEHKELWRQQNGR